MQPHCHSKARSLNSKMVYFFYKALHPCLYTSACVAVAFANRFRIACEQAPSEVGKKFGIRSEWESEHRDSASETSGRRGSLPWALPPHQTALGSSRSPETTFRISHAQWLPRSTDVENSMIYTRRYKDPCRFQVYNVPRVRDKRTARREISICWKTYHDDRIVSWSTRAGW